MSRFLTLIIALIVMTPAHSATYKIDKEGAHAFIQFRIKHLGYSWLYGRFNDFSGQFEWDAKKPEKNSVMVDINTHSVDTNHAERDKHIRSEDFLNVKKFSSAKFFSTKIESQSPDKAKITGDLTLMDVTKTITLEATFMGEGKDPWGGYRAGFEAYTTLKPADFGIPTDKKLGQTEMEFMLTLEGIRQ